MTRSLRVLFLLLLITVLMRASAAATPLLELRLSSGATEVTIIDGQAGDMNPAAGAITFVGPIGDWNINVSTGLGEPVLPAATMDLNSVHTSSAGTASTLQILLTQIHNSIIYPGWAMEFGGTSTNVSSISYSAYVDDDDRPFFTTSQIGSTIGPFSSSPFQGVASGPVSVSDLYSLTQVLSITGNGSPGAFNMFSADAELSPVPEPASLLLFGSGLSGAAAWARRKRQLRRSTSLISR